MKSEIFEYSDYKHYLQDYIKNQPNRGRGQKLRIAAATGCQMGYVSQVLNESAHFNLEQSERLSRYLAHSQEESHYFLLLVQLARAGTKELRTYFSTQIQQVNERRLVLKNRFQTAQTLVEGVDQTTYYSAWYYAAIHILLTIPECRTKTAISTHLKMDIKKVNEVLEFLQKAGLVKQKGNEFEVGSSRIFLGNDNPLISKHHANWRLKALQSLEKETSADLHYSSVVSVSATDMQKIKVKLVKEIEELRSVIKESKEEKLYSLCVDWFEV